MRRPIASLILVVLASSSASGCFLAIYDWDADRPSTHDVSGIDASDIDVAVTDGPAALRGTIRYPVPMGGGLPGALDPAQGVLRVNVYPFVTDTDAASLDVTGIDTGAADANVQSPACLAMLGRPPTYSLSIYPAPNPASYLFDNVPIGRYCVFVVLDMPPFYTIAEMPGCEDPRASAPDVLVTAPLTTAPDLFLDYPARCW